MGEQKEQKTHSVNTTKERKCDESALVQGRKPISQRTLGERVSIEHMTPKEYRSLQAGIWDGIERRPGLQNWSPFDFEREMTPTQKKIVDTQPKDVERRVDERRQVIDRRSAIEERRQEQRRKEDQTDHLTHYICLGVLALILGYWVVKAIQLGGVS